MIGIVKLESSGFQHLAALYGLHQHFRETCCLPSSGFKKLCSIECWREMGEHGYVTSPVSGKVYIGPIVQSIETRVNERVIMPAGEVGPGRMHC
jgi:hypothetical protein